MDNHDGPDDRSLWTAEPGGGLVRCFDSLDDVYEFIAREQDRLAEVASPGAFADPGLGRSRRQRY
jgi:hypothetical protein